MAPNGEQTTEGFVSPQKKCKIPIIPSAYFMTLSSTRECRAQENTTKMDRLVFGCPSLCHCNSGTRSLIAWMNCADTPVTTCCLEARGIGVTLTWRWSGSLLPSHITRLSLFSWGPSIKLWARCSEGMGVETTLATSHQVPEGVWEQSVQVNAWNRSTFWKYSARFLSNTFIWGFR